MGNFIVADNRGIEFQCFCQGYKKENLVLHPVFLEQGDLLTITNRKKYIVDVGWFILVKINDSQEEFLPVDELEEAMTNEALLDEIGCMLKMLSISYYLDQALAIRNKKEFIKYSSIRNKFATLYERLCEKVYIET
ncbi:hypothetical protein [Ureibacillus terrenus]|uniref:IDEAL domain-containing protein n=1 Tax=Ureibacillus terrenus TaxID=118246 RepID=A0A540V2X0_9BACL|nr:hypothetical protein [Ureibacillus terrenus]MED3763594.1 hypothetical protein [Ureibacillus terrenus]TQE91080.1 hypothetical protein FKZ59_07130 [Ureibacillus terrenus]